MSRTSLSIVIPAYNERESLPVLIDEIERLRLRLRDLDDVIVVDDGSDDGTESLMADLASRRPWLRLLRHEVNRGQTAALASGFEVARGDLVATLDADLQNDPRDIPGLIDVMNESGADMVTGVRAERHDSLWRRFQSWIGNRVRNWITGDRVSDTGCSLRVARREVVDGLLDFDGAHRFVPTLARIRGASVVEEPVSHRPRRFGVSKYGAWNRALAGLWRCLEVRRRMKRALR